MNRRKFLIGTGVFLGGAAVPAAARVEAPRIQLADLRGSFAATEFGVTPDASDDQSATLQTALDRAAADGKPVFLPPGRYEVSSLALPSGAKLVGIPGQTRLVYGGGGHLLQAFGASDVGLDGLVIDGANRALGDGVPGLVHLMRAEGVTIERCTVAGSTRHGIALEGVSGRVTANRIGGAREAGLWSVNATGLEITDNVVSDCGDGGILVHRWDRGEDGTIVARNRVERIDARSGGTGQFGNGINVYQARGVMISGNRVADCAFSAIRSNSGDDVQITGNQCHRSGETAIYSEFAFEGAVISGNLVDGAAMGIVTANADKGGRLAAISGNLVRNLENGAPYPDQLGFDFGVGIYAEADAAITGNVIDKAPTAGMMLGWGPYLGNVVATGNVIRDVGVGIGVTVVEGAGVALIANNLIAGARQGAIRGMRWAAFTTPELAGATTNPLEHLTLSENRVD